MLLQLVIVIERIQGFPVTSPLIKFVTGLEVLLSKAQVCHITNVRSLKVLTNHSNK